MDDWAAQILRRDREDNATDTLNEAWATVLPPIPVEGGQLSGYIEDLSGRLNINDLLKAPDAQGVMSVNPVMRERFRRLFNALSLNPDLVLALIDWLDADVDPSFPGGAEDVEYMQHELPYRAANTLMVSPSELLLIQGIDYASYQLLLPHIATLPRGATLNVNTATVPVLMSLADNISESDAEQIVSERGEDGFADINAFMKLDALAGRSVVPDMLGVATDYFMISSAIQVGAINLPYKSIMHRDGAGVVTTLFRAQGI